MNQPQLRVSVLVPVLAFSALSALAQDFPSKPVRLVIHNQPGGPTDVIARAMAPAMSKSLGQPVVVENRAGASGMVAYEFVAKQVAPDGYTLVSGGSQHATLKVFVKDLRFDPLKDLAPVSWFGEGMLVLTASAGSPFRTFAEFVAYAKANPGRLNWGTSGFTTGATLNTFSVLQRHGLDVVQVPFSGNAPARTELLANRIQLLWLTEGDYAADADGGRVRGLAVSGARRLPALPDIPALAEAGHPEIVGFFLGYSVPAGTPRPALDRLNASVRASLEERDVREFFAKSRVYSIAMSPEESRKKLEELAAAYAQIALKAGISPK